MRQRKRFLVEHSITHLENGCNIFLKKFKKFLSEIKSHRITTIIGKELIRIV